MIGDITLRQCTCEKCGHTWIPRTILDPPVACPKCKRTNWNTPRTQSNG